MITPKRLAWSLWVFSLVGFATSAVLGAQTEESAFDATYASFIVFVLAFSTVGTLIASRLPRNPLGWMLSASAIAYILGGLAVTLVEYWDAQPGDQPGEVTVAWVGTWVWSAAIGMLPLILLLFPNGRPPTRRWRYAVWAGAAGTTLMIIGVAFVPGKMEGTGADNPFGVESAGGFVNALAELGFVLLLLALLAGVVSVFVRFRRAGGYERMQLKWLMYAAALAALCTVVAVTIEALSGTGEEVSDVTNTLITTTWALIPVSIGVAILRHRLYDIDRVINRTLVYGALTVVLAGVYVAGVLVLQSVLEPLTQDSAPAIAGTTLATAALFRPARARIQRDVDRRFYRSRYDAAATVDGFGERLRHQTDLDALASELIAVVSATIGPESASVWLRPAGGETGGPSDRFVTISRRLRRRKGPR
jgi:hypothetical protein